jgi:hypothetical protein
VTFSVDRVERVAWSCVHFTGDGPDEDELIDRGIALVRIQADEVSDDGELLGALAFGFSFPDNVGRNWDAVGERLRDLKWLPAEGYVLVVAGAEGLWRRTPRLAAELLRSWLSCAEHWARRETPFHLVFEW